MTKKIDYWTAIEWICDNCGRNNFSSMVKPSLTAEEEKKVKDDLGMEAWQEGEFLMAPSEVHCQFCDTSFELNH